MVHIISNKIQCVHCGDIVFSDQIHDYATCRCGAVSVDGGHYYLKRNFKYSPNDYLDLSEYWEDDEDD